MGAQVLQKIAQQVRVSENKIVMAEKVAALSKVYQNAAWPQTSMDEAWRTLMLSQHHDCWIVPYNGRPGNTWADKVVVWTGGTNRISDSIISNAFTSAGSANADNRTIRVYNTTGNKRNELVKLLLPPNSNTTDLTIVDDKNKEVLSQKVSSKEGVPQIYFKAEVPPVGYNTYTIVNKKPSAISGARTSVTNEGDVVLETDLYKLVIDKLKGGSIKSLIAKTLKNKEFVDVKNARGFNEMRGNFFNDGGFHSTSENPVTVTVVEKGPAIVKAEIKGMILTHPYTQVITLKQGEKRIDCNVRIDWKSNIGIGDDYKQQGGLDSKDYTKPFYDDSKKLMALFPLNFSSQKIYKDAPLDVTESKLDNTFFRTWDSIKNNVVVSWVDVYDAKNNYGLALLTDQTTNYAHGENFPLGMNIQYSGVGLWGRNYTIAGPTQINYALVPHAGKWDEGHISTEGVNWNEPLLASFISSAKEAKKSLVDVTGTGLQVTTVLADGNDLLVRLFNAEGDTKSKMVAVGGQASGAEFVELNGVVKQTLKTKKGKNNTTIDVAMPRFGIRTIRLKNFQGI